MTEALFEAGLALHRAGRPGEAEPYYRAVLDADPDHAQALQFLAVVALQSGRQAWAVELIERALRGRPGSVELWSNLGAACGTLGRNRDSERCFHRALALQPDHAATLHNLGNACLRDDRAAEAARQYGRALRLDPVHAPSASRLEQIRSVWGARLDEAERRDRLAKDAGSAPAFAMSAAAWLDVGDRDRAEARRALTLDAADGPANRLLGDLLL